MVGARGEDVAGLERVDGGDPLDAPGILWAIWLVSRPTAPGLVTKQAR